MKKYTLAFHWIVWFIIATYALFLSCNNHQDDAIGEVIQNVRTEHAPDRRSAIFEVNYELKGKELLLRGEIMSDHTHRLLLDSLSRFDVAITDSLTVLPQVQLYDDTLALVKLSVCNIRSEPRHSAELVTQELMGHIVRVWKRDGSWFYIQTPDKYLGWVDSAAIIRGDKAFIEAWNAKPKVLVTDVYTWVYQNPQAKAPPVCDLVAGNVLAIRNEKEVNGFIQVELPDTRSGFVPQNACLKGDVVSGKPVTGESILETAGRFRGIPYLWGGTSAKGFDCSGYTKTVFDLHGMHLPRDASQQVMEGVDLGTALDFNRFCPGDLLFFGSIREDGSERVTHVAIYAGDGRIIHAAGEVQVQSLNKGNPDYAEDRVKTFLRAKRLLGEYACKQESQPG